VKNIIPLIAASIFTSLIVLMLAGHHYYELERGVAFFDRHSSDIVRIAIKMSIAIGVLTFAADYVRKVFFPQKSTVEITVSQNS
jgi:hypothetical protein